MIEQLLPAMPVIQRSANYENKRFRLVRLGQVVVGPRLQTLAHLIR